MQPQVGSQMPIMPLAWVYLPSTVWVLLVISTTAQMNISNSIVLLHVRLCWQDSLQQSVHSASDTPQDKRVQKKRIPRQVSSHANPKTDFSLLHYVA